MSHEIIFVIGLFLGLLFGFCIAGLFSSNKIEEAWHDGYRAGKYRGINNI
jgi:hypothetical protein